MGNQIVVATRAGQSTADAVCADLALENYDLSVDNRNLREANRQLVDLVADLAFENAVLQEFADTHYRGWAQRGQALRQRAASA